MHERGLFFSDARNRAMQIAGNVALGAALATGLAGEALAVRGHTTPEYYSQQEVAAGRPSAEDYFNAGVWALCSATAVGMVGLAAHRLS